MYLTIDFNVSFSNLRIISNVLSANFRSTPERFDVQHKCLLLSNKNDAFIHATFLNTISNKEIKSRSTLSSFANFPHSFTISSSR